MNRRITTSRFTNHLAALLAAFVTLLLSQSVFATSGTWSGSASAAWTNTANWSASPVPGTGEIATFNGAGNGNTTIDLTGGVTVGASTFDTASAAAYTIGTGGAGGQTLTLSASGGIRMNSTVTNNQLFNANLSLGTAAGAKVFVITNNSTTASLTLAGAISTAQTGNITNIFAGSGTVIISGPISNGSGSILLQKTNNPGTVVLTTSNNFTGLLFNTGTGTGDCGAVRVAHSDALTGVTIQMNGQNATTQTIELTNNITLTNNIGSNSRDVGRPMIRSISGTNTYAGTYIATATGGGITFEANSGKLNLTGALLSNVGVRGVQLQGTGAGEVSYTYQSTNVSAVTKTGSGTWTLTASNGYTGGTTINGGTLNVAHTNALGTGLITMGGTSNAVLNFATDGGDYTNALNAGSGSTWTLSSDVKTGSVGINHTLGTFTIGSGAPALQMNVVRGPYVLSGSPRITVSTFSLTAGVGGTTIINPTTADITLPAVTATATSKTLQLDGTSTGNQITGAITDGGANVITLVKTNSSTWTLSGANTYTGKTTVGQGTLALTGSATIGSTNIFVGGAGIFDVSGLSGGALTLNSGQTLSGNGAVKGTIDCGAGAITPGASAGTLTVTNLTLSGSGFLNYELANVTTIGGGTNDYIVVPGTLTLGGLTTLNVTYLNAVPSSTGKYTLISYGTYSGPAGDISANFSIPSGFTITNNPTTKAIELLPNHTPVSVLWVGNNGNAWDFTTLNWVSPDSLFYNGDSPRFDDTATTTGTINLTTPAGCGTLTMSNTLAYNFTGSSVTAGSLSKQSSGTLTLENDVNVTTGTLISGGTLQVGNGGSTGTLTGSGVTNNGALNFNRTDAVVLNAPVSGSGSLTQLGTGSLALNASNSYSGPTTVAAGVVFAPNANSLGSSASGTTVSNGAQLYITANVDLPAETLAISGTGPATDGSLRKGGAGLTALGSALTLGADSSINVDAGATLTLSNTISGSTFALTKLGGGALTLTTNSTLTGGFTLSAGTLNIGAAEALGQAPGAFTIAGGSALDNISGAPLTLTQNPAINWNGDLTFNGTTNLNLGTGTVTMNAGHGLRASGALLTIPGNITGGFAVTVEGAGIVALSGSNDFSGLFLDAGTQEPATVRLSNPDAAGRGNIEYNGGGNSTSGRVELLGGITVTNKLHLSGRNVDANAVQNLSGSNTLSGTLSVTVGGSLYLIQSDAGTLTFNGATGDGIAMTVEAGSRNFTVRGAGDTVVSGIITNGAGTASVIKSGTGKLTLSAENSYTGLTTVNNGTLLVNGSIATGAVTNSGGTLGGTGTINGPVYVDVAGTLAPGASISTLTISNDLNLAGNLAIEINKSTSPTNDYCVVSGGLTNLGTGLVIVTNEGPALVAGDSFKLFSQAVFNGGAFTVTNGLGAGLAWTNKLAVDGTIAVVSTASGPALNPTNLTSSVTGGTTLNLSWPSDHLGWFLQTQTNSRSVGLKPQTNFWFDVSGSSTITNTSLTLDKTQPTIFFRLRSP